MFSQTGWGVAKIAALVVALGAGNAWAAPGAMHGGKVSGLVRPMGLTRAAASGPPSAAFAWSPASPTAGSGVAFYEETWPGSAPITSYSWNLGDGTTSTVAVPIHAYTLPATYAVTLTVTQVGGATASSTQLVTVIAASAGAGGGGSGSAGSSSAGSGSTSAGGAGSGSAGSGSAGSGSATGANGTGAQVARPGWLSRLLDVSGGQLRIPTLLRRNGAMTTIRAATATGKLKIAWYAAVKHRRVVVARGAQSVSAGVTAHISIRLTLAGRRLLGRGTGVRLTAVGNYAFSHSHIKSTRPLSLTH